NRADVHMRLCTLEFTFCHSLFPWTAGTFSSVECGAISDCGRKTQVSCGRGFLTRSEPMIRFSGMWRGYRNEQEEMEWPKTGSAAAGIQPTDIAASACPPCRIYCRIWPIAGVTPV
ncbi:hypothetical protein, partial [Mesorhizobium sp.]|uniref:hypothetical protein n=1 Tax=Mesorhizobium sp. TaxID=1871066 RepID=UPI002580E566